MESVLRRLRLKKSEPRESEARKKLQNELFSLDKYLEQGFPYKPSALALDSRLSLLAIGTKSGALKIYGRPGVRFSGQHKHNVAIFRIVFLQDQGRLVTLCSDNSLHLWEINVDANGCSAVEEISFYVTETGSKQQSFSACCLSLSSERLYLGTDRGDVQVFCMQKFTMTESNFSQESVTQSALSEFQHNPGAVEFICQHPTSHDKILIGFDRGLIVLWNVESRASEHVYVSLQQLETLSFNRTGSEFISCHSDGSYIVWTVDKPDYPKESASTPYGPFPCKAITKMEWKSTSVGEPFMIFSGGMPRASHGEKYTVTIMQGDSEHVVLDFTSKVIDFVTICSGVDQTDLQYDEPAALILLAEEELVAIDLSSPGWPTFVPPYLCSLHNSAITCIAHSTNVSEVMWNKITDVGRMQFANCSKREWPIQGGIAAGDDIHERDMLLTGHEDGSVRFWDSSASGLRLLYKLTTASFFNVDTSAHLDLDAGIEWPPFRKVGQYDPFTDDPRLAVQQICLCVMSEMLIVAGSSGQVVVMQFERDERDSNVRISTVGIADRSDGNDGLVWCGYTALEVQCSEGSDSKMSPGFQPFCIVQLQPPVTCLSAALHSEWQLFAVGTAFGFCVFDYAQRKPVFARCTLMPQGSADKVPLTRRKSIQRSVRQSFRRLRRYRSESSGTRVSRKPESSSETRLKSQKTEEPLQGEGDGTVLEKSPPDTHPQSAPAKLDASTPCTSSLQQQQPGSCATANNLSTVGFLYFAETFLLDAHTPVATLWAGTNAGNIMIYHLVVPSSGRRAEDAVQCVLAKGIQLRHGAPVVNLTVLDRASCPLPAPLEVQHERAKAPDMTGGHHVVISSREQIKVFTLPNLKPSNKFKFVDSRKGVSTQQEALTLRLASFARFRSISDNSYVEHDLMCLLSNGAVVVLNVPELRRQIMCDVIDKDNLVGLSLCVFTQNGKGIYLHTPSEIRHFSLSANFSVRLPCRLAIRDGVRVPLSMTKSSRKQSSSDVDKSSYTNHSPAPLSSSEPSVVRDETENMEVDHRRESPAADGDVTFDSVQIHLNVCALSQSTGLSTIDTTIAKLNRMSQQGDVEAPSSITASTGDDSRVAKVSDAYVSISNWNPDVCTLKREVAMEAMLQQQREAS